MAPEAKSSAHRGGRRRLAGRLAALAVGGTRAVPWAGALRASRIGLSALGRRVGLAAAPVVCASCAPVAAGDSRPPGPVTFAFALLGDTPYGTLEAAALRRLLASLDDSIDFVIHVGDLKSGASTCDDALLRSRRDLLASSPRPLVFVPGDNDWTDCHRRSAGRFDPLERLDRLRELFFRTPAALGRGHLPLRQQAAWTGHEGRVLRRLPENCQWHAGGVRFVTLNVPGSADGRDASLPAGHQQARAVANRDWLLDAATTARAEGAGALAIALHANPAIERAPTTAQGGGDPYAPLRAWIADAMRAFPGEVLLLHGDTHRFRSDRPWRGATGLEPRLRRLQRVECYGSPFAANWVRVGWHAGSRRFTATSQTLRFD